jgi:von Willebrand factor type A domain
MSAIWIILLDTSSSMDEGFTQASGASGGPLDETGAWAKKIDAAKDLLLSQVASLRAQDVAVFRFTDTSQKIFHGTRDALLANQSLITSLDASGGTDIAAALLAVGEDADFEQYRSLSIQLLTDGQSDQAAAKNAVEVLISKYPFARIDTILIDETPEGRAVAEAVSVNGTVRTATSTVQLRQALTGARAASLRSELASMAQVRFLAQQELARFQQSAQPTLIRVTSGERLTSETLRNDIAPTLAGIEMIGQSASWAAHREYQGTVSSISQDSPISINLSGLKETVDLVLAYVIPWRRQNAEKLSHLEVQKHELEIRKQENDLSFYGLEQEQRRLETAKAQYELAKSKWELAEKIFKELYPENELRGIEKQEAISRILAGIDQLASTRLEFEVVREISRQ